MTEDFIYKNIEGIQNVQIHNKQENSKNNLNEDLSFLEIDFIKYKKQRECNNKEEQRNLYFKEVWIINQERSSPSHGSNLIILVIINRNYFSKETKKKLKEKEIANESKSKRGISVNNQKKGLVRLN